MKEERSEMWRPFLPILLGGHPEPSVPLFCMTNVKSINITDYEDAAKVDSETVTNELFYSMQREVFEESNIPLTNLSDMFMIGVMAYGYVLDLI